MQQKDDIASPTNMMSSSDVADGDGDNLGVHYVQPVLHLVKLVRVNYNVLLAILHGEQTNKPYCICTDL